MAMSTSKATSNCVKAPSELEALSADAEVKSLKASRQYQAALKKQDELEDGKKIDLNQLIKLYENALKLKQEALEAHTVALNEANEILDIKPYDSEAFKKKELHEKQKKNINYTIEELKEEIEKLEKKKDGLIDAPKEKESSRKSSGASFTPLPSVPESEISKMRRNPESALENPPLIQKYLKDLFIGKYDLTQGQDKTYDPLFESILLRQDRNLSNLLAQYFTYLRHSFFFDYNHSEPPGPKLDRLKQLMKRYALEAPLDFHQYFLQPVFASASAISVKNISSIAEIIQLNNYLHHWGFFPNALGFANPNAVDADSFQHTVVSSFPPYPLSEEEANKTMELLKNTLRDEPLLATVKRCITSVDKSLKLQTECIQTLNNVMEQLFDQLNRLAKLSISSPEAAEATNEITRKERKEWLQMKTDTLNALGHLFIASIRNYPHLLDSKPRFQREFSFAESLDKSPEEFNFSIAKDLNRERKNVFIAELGTEAKKILSFQQLMDLSKEYHDSVNHVDPQSSVEEFLKTNLIPELEQKGFASESRHAHKFMYGATQETLHAFPTAIFEERPGIQKILQKDANGTSSEEIDILDNNHLYTPFKWSFLNVETKMIKTYMIVTDAITKNRTPPAIIEKEQNCADPDPAVCGKARYKIIPWSDYHVSDATKFFFGLIWDSEDAE